MKKIFYVCLMVLSLSFIFFNSSQDGNKSNLRSNNFIEKIVTVVEENNDYIHINQKVHINMKEFNLVIRKFAHGFEFAMLSIILFNCFYLFSKNKNKNIKYILILILLFAMMDEFLQLYIPGRNSSVKDVIIDFIGGCFGIIIIKILNYIKFNLNNKLAKNKITIL